ncbi:hypothetical protein OGATHE_003091 [Ogataea polymorpha]|uniref:Uncharacterized protein n=1 Tax=Ogataea polymorpha TaxID=460523 RepID=A0A9P8P879_9ASCO|nr:hypothetical protein OGATHE_003091 [Ogataea polymorpha]
MNFLFLGSQRIVTSYPSIDHSQRALRLVVWNHVSSIKHSSKCELASILDFADLGAILQGEVVQLGGLELLVSRPWELIRPGLVSEPIADEILVSCVDQDRKTLFQKIDNILVVRFHPITSKQEVSVHVEITRLWVGQTVANQHRGEVERSVSMSENLGGKHWNVMTTVRLTSDVEVVLQQVWELLVEQLQEGVNVFTSCDRVRDRLGRVRESNVDRLVKKNNSGIGIPRIWVIDWFEIWTDGGRAELKKHSSQGRASWTTVEPENHRVVGRVISGLKHPIEEMLVFILHIQNFSLKTLKSQKSAGFLVILTTGSDLSFMFLRVSGNLASISFQMSLNSGEMFLEDSLTTSETRSSKDLPFSTNTSPNLEFIPRGCCPAVSFLMAAACADPMQVATRARTDIESFILGNGI